MICFTPDEWSEINSSSNIAAIGTKDGYLLVEFHTGDVYRYADLAGHFEAFKEASSVGRYFHQHIRAETCNRLRGGDWPDE